MWGLQKQDERKQAARCRECANARHSEIVRERYAVAARARYVVKELQHVMYKEDPQSVEDDLPMITNSWRFSKERKQFPTDLTFPYCSACGLAGATWHSVASSSHRKRRF